MLLLVHCVQVMEDMLASAEAKSAVLVSAKPGCFIAGADIAWLDSAKDKDEVLQCHSLHVMFILERNSQLTETLCQVHSVYIIVSSASADIYEWSSNDAETRI